MDAEFIRQEESAKAIKKSGSLITEQLVSMATAQALLFTPKETQEWPIADFDMKYFVEVMLNPFNEKDHDTLRRVLGGEDLRWWNDDDEF